MPRTFTIGISGISSSGKTTLSRYLRTIFRSSLVLFQDDYYLPDSSIPVSSSGLQDWDCVDAFDFSKLGQTLDYVHKHGVLPPDTKTITDDSPVGEKLVDDKFVEEMRARVAGAGLREDIKIVFLEGILLFQQGNIVENKLDARILLRAPYERAKQRREARTRYVTIEGFWEDPPGYFDKIVWPNYV
ncbi:P-loop containing nucleoside triphosphate hydrolase protein, partial [Geopyxis carbonaria]